MVYRTRCVCTYFLHVLLERLPFVFDGRAVAPMCMERGRGGEAQSAMWSIPVSQDVCPLLLKHALLVGEVLPCPRLHSSPTIISHFEPNIRSAAVVTGSGSTHVQKMTRQLSGVPTWNYIAVEGPPCVAMTCVLARSHLRASL